MRNEEEMMRLILNFALEHEDVRAVVLNGSRADPSAKRDQFQDYDVVYLVRDVEIYRKNKAVSEYFGELMILQLPDDMGESLGGREAYAHLMQFMDGNRIDLTFFPVKAVRDAVADSLSVVLLDKDGIINPLPPPSLRSYLPNKPTDKEFQDCCNEFWWLNTYVAKGLYRGQITYSKAFLDTLMRDQLMNMMTWHVGMNTNFEVPVGYLGKNLEGLVEKDVWTVLMRTYSDANPKNIWDALITMDELFRNIAKIVASSFGFLYPERDDSNVSTHVARLRQNRPESAI